MPAGVDPLLVARAVRGRSSRCDPGQFEAALLGELPEVQHHFDDTVTIPLTDGGSLRTAIGWLLRLYSYLFHLILSLFFVGIAIVASLSGKPLTLKMLPWAGAALNHWVLGLGLAGLLCTVLAVTGIFRWIFPLWTLLVFALMLRGFFLTSYDFGGASEFRGAAWLTFGAFGAFLSSLSVLDRRDKRRR